jgi:Flp pilus assembly protein TadG
LRGEERGSVLTMNSRLKTRRTSQGRCGFRRLARRYCDDATAIVLKFTRRLRETDAAELLEFALALPIILVMVSGLLDFSRAYNIKQKLSNAVREGARVEAMKANNATSSSPSSLPTLRDDVVAYLNSANVDTSFIGTTSTYDPATCTGTWYTTVGTSTTQYGLRVEKCVQVVDGGATIPSTRVTLYYPYDWTFGFDYIIKLLIPSSKFTGPIRIEADATISNFS